MVASLVAAGAHVYVCGGTAMARDVKEAFSAALSSSKEADSAAPSSTVKEAGAAGDHGARNAGACGVSDGESVCGESVCGESVEGSREDVGLRESATAAWCTSVAQLQSAGRYFQDVWG